MLIGKYSFGIGDRFGQQGAAQLKAVLKARNLGVELIPVWNKSYREHQIIGTEPEAVRKEADEAVKALAYAGPYFVDADHINSDTVAGFLTVSDFFTLDVAQYIGQKGTEAGLDRANRALMGLGDEVKIQGLKDAIILDEKSKKNFLDNYLAAVEAASELYKLIIKEKGEGGFIPEVSMDEVDLPQKPADILMILALLSEFNLPAQTLAPKFTGRFNKGVDYVGDPEQFEEEFEADLLVIKHGIKAFGLPENLKLSIHSGSDKFSIYPIIGRLLRKHDAGIHVKTAGTTWLEELIGLALGDEAAVSMVRAIYKEALERQKELCGPYADVIDIQSDRLPDSLDHWSGEEIAQALRHIPENPKYNSSMRQLFHVGYKLAAERGPCFYSALKDHAEIIFEQVEENIYDRHICRLFEV